MLGHKLCQVLSERFQVHATFRQFPVEAAALFERVRVIDGVDATRPEMVSDAISRVRPDVTINAIGLVKQRREASQAIQAIELNSLLPHRAYAACEAFGGRFIQVSTDCVFSGDRGGYRETDRPDATDLYGRSKLLGEVDGANALTIRTSIIGRELFGTGSLLEWFLSHTGGSVEGYARAVFSGLTTRALARIIADVIIADADVWGRLWHVSSKPIEKYELLKALNSALHADVTIQRDDEYRIDRSLNSDRFWAATGLSRPTWAEMIAELASDPTPYAGIRRRRSVPA